MADEPQDSGHGPTLHKADSDGVATFHYIKSHHFRVIHADGAIGSVTPKGFIHFALWSERQALPRKMSFHLQDDGKLGNMASVESREGYVREMEADVFFTLDGARDFRDWLNQIIDEAENKAE